MQPAIHPRRVAPDQKAQALDRLSRARMGLGWKHPFFFPVLARTVFRISADMPTACVDLKGVIRVNPFFLTQLSDAEVQGVIAHECLHLILLHQDRRANRAPYRWNKATDRIINLTLKLMGIVLPDDCLYAEDDQKDWTAEQLYEVEPECDEQGYSPWVVPVGQGCGPSADGDGPGQDGQGQDDDGEGGSDGAGPQTEEGWRRQWREIAAQCANQAKEAGSTAGSAFAKLLEIPPPRVRWAQVLRGALYRALAEAGRDDVSWSRRSRRSTTTIILPGGVTYKCKAAVVIDSSGSMSDEDLAHCVSETAAIVNHTRVPTFLVVHDHAVQEAVWIQPGARTVVLSQIQKRLKGRGGTSFDEAYERVEDEGRFNVMVHLTDGGIFGDWPDPPRSVRRFVVALLGASIDTEVPATAKIIEADL